MDGWVDDYAVKYLKTSAGMIGMCLRAGRVGDDGRVIPVSRRRGRHGKRGEKDTGRRVLRDKGESGKARNRNAGWRGNWGQELGKIFVLTEI